MPSVSHPALHPAPSVVSSVSLRAPARPLLAALIGAGALLGACSNIQPGLELRAYDDSGTRDSSYDDSDFRKSVAEPSRWRQFER